MKLLYFYCVLVPQTFTCVKGSAIHQICGVFANHRNEYSPSAQIELLCTHRDFIHTFQALTLALAQNGEAACTQEAKSFQGRGRRASLLILVFQRVAYGFIMFSLWLFNMFPMHSHQVPSGYVLCSVFVPQVLCARKLFQKHHIV